MTRGQLGRVAVLCLGVMGGACASRKDTPAPAPEAQTPAPAQAEEGAQMATKLECALSVPEKVKAGEPVEVVFRLTNRTQAPLYVLDWHTPLEGLLNNIFTVTKDGQELSYGGPMLKRGPPQADDYVTVAPGASVEGRVDVSLAYDMKQPGTYRIAYTDRLRDVATDKAQVPGGMGELREMPVQCPAVETTVTP